MSKITPAGSSVYSATKGAVNAVTGSFARELGPRKVRVNALNLGMVEAEGAIAEPPFATERICLMHTLLASMIHIGLFGGSSVATTYLPEETKHHVVPEKELSAAYPGQEIKVSNLADNGEFIARYLLSGKYEIHRADLTGLDVAITRFGTNDIKRMKGLEYQKQLDKFVALLQEEAPPPGRVITVSFTVRSFVLITK